MGLGWCCVTRPCDCSAIYVLGVSLPLSSRTWRDHSRPFFCMCHSSRLLCMKQRQFWSTERKVLRFKELTELHVLSSLTSSLRRSITYRHSYLSSMAVKLPSLPRYVSYNTVVDRPKYRYEGVRFSSHWEYSKFFFSKYAFITRWIKSFFTTKNWFQ